MLWDIYHTDLTKPGWGEGGKRVERKKSILWVWLARMTLFEEEKKRRRKIEGRNRKINANEFGIVH